MKIIAALAFTILLAALPAGGVGTAGRLKGAALRAGAAPRRVARVSEGLIGARLHKGRGLVADISLGTTPLRRLRNARGLTLTLGPLPQAIQAQPAAGLNASAHWREYAEITSRL